MTLLRFSAFACVATATFLWGDSAILHAQTLVADYQLQSTYASSVGAIGPLTVTGTASGASFSTATVDGQSQKVLTIQTNNTTPPFTQTGVRTQTSPFLNPANYSIVLLADFRISTADVLATKVLDFKNLSSDAGLYLNDASGIIEFNDPNGVLLGQGGTPLPSSTYIQLTLTRNSATNLVSLYSNGTLAFSFTDTNGYAVLGDATNTGNSFLTLFQDEGGGLGGTTLDEGTLGDIARLRLYDGVLSATAVANLDRTVPEPSTWALLGVGALALVAGLRRRAAVA